MNMKQFFYTVLLIASFLLSSCSDINKEKNVDLPDMSSLGLTRAHEEIAASQMDFGVEIFKSLAEQKEMENFLVSPFCLSLDLAMLASGAEGMTYQELVKGLGFEDYTAQQLGEYYSAVIKNDCSDPYTTFKTANAAWINLGLSTNVKESYVKEVKTLYDASVEAMDFRTNDMLSIINKWGSDNTEGLIKDALSDRPDPSSLMLLTNALYFNGKWTNGMYFQPVNKPFTNLNGSVSNRVFFHCGNLFYSEYNTAWDNPEEPAMLTLSYGNGSFKMLIIVPPADIRFDKFVGDLSASGIMTMLKQSRTSNDVFKANEMVNWYVPEFNTYADLKDREMIKALYNCGIKRIFGGGLSKISDNKDIAVNSVTQKAIIDVNREGTTAAAVTVITLGSGSYFHQYNREYDFVVDRPFVYAIIDDFQSILFMGMVTNLN